MLEMLMLMRGEGQLICLDIAVYGWRVKPVGATKPTA